MPDIIPAVWRIDVEPDEFQPWVGAEPWVGFETMATRVDAVRERLQAISGNAVHPTWLLRLDPDLERVYGSVDFVVRQHRGLFDRLVGHGDPLGLHIHPYRWDPVRKTAYSEHMDVAWLKDCIAVAADAFAGSFGRPATIGSFGGYFLSEAVADAMIARGFEVDLTVEPGLEPKEMDASFGGYATGPSGDFRNCPRRPYYPSRESLAIPATSASTRRPLLLVPVTSYDHETALTTWPRRVAKILLRRPRRHLPLSPWKWWPSPKAYWDLVERAADEGPACYFAFAMRTNTPGTEIDRRVQGLLEHLPQHPIARRLKFVDPLSPEIRALAIPQVP